MSSVQPCCAYFALLSSWTKKNLLRVALWNDVSIMRQKLLFTHQLSTVNSILQTVAETVAMEHVLFGAVHLLAILCLTNPILQCMHAAVTG